MKALVEFLAGDFGSEKPQLDVGRLIARIEPWPSGMQRRDVVFEIIDAITIERAHHEDRARRKRRRQFLGHWQQLVAGKQSTLLSARLALQLCCQELA